MSLITILNSIALTLFSYLARVLESHNVEFCRLKEETFEIKPSLIFFQKLEQPFLRRLLTDRKKGFYEDYLASLHWRCLRELKLKINPRCEKCHRQFSSMEVHHLHYKTLGEEKLEDLQTLCRLCHMQTWS